MTVNLFLDFLEIRFLRNQCLSTNYWIGEFASSSKEKADCFFESVFAVDDNKDTTVDFDYSLTTEFDDFFVTEARILHMLKGIDVSKSCSPDGVTRAQNFFTITTKALGEGQAKCISRMKNLKLP